MEKKEKSKSSNGLEPTVKAVLIADSEISLLEEVLKSLAAHDYKKIDFLLIQPSKEKARVLRGLRAKNPLKRGFWKDRATKSVRFTMFSRDGRACSRKDATSWL